MSTTRQYQKLSSVTADSQGDVKQAEMKESTFWEAIKENWKEGLPIVISTAALQGSTFWGMKLLAQYGGDYNSAEQAINAIYYLVYFASTMPFLAVNQFISTKFHDEEVKGEIINDIAASGINVIIISVPTIFALPSARSVLQQMGQPDSVVEIAGDYFDVYRYAVLPAIASSAISQVLTGLKDTPPLAVVNTLSAAACVIAQYAFVRGEMGQSPGYASGLAKASMIQALTSATFLLGYLMAKLYRHPEWRTKLSIRSTLKNLLGQSLFGLVIDLIVSAETGALFLLTGLVGKYLGKKGLADFNIITQYFSIGVPLQIAIRQGSTAIIGRIKSERDHIVRLIREGSIALDVDDAVDRIHVRNANRAIYAGILNCSIVASSQFLCAVSATGLIVKAFEEDATSSDISEMRSLFIVYSIVQAFDAIRNMYGAGMAANKNVVVPFMVSLFLILGATVGFSALDLALEGGLLDVFGINGAAIAAAVGGLGFYWHKKELEAFRLTYVGATEAKESDASAQNHETASLVKVTTADSTEDSQWGKAHNVFKRSSSRDMSSVVSDEKNNEEIRIQK